MTKKPPVLPNIEDDTLRACLAPLVDAMNPGIEPVAPITQAFVSAGVQSGVTVTRAREVPDGPPSSNDNPVPSAGTIGACDFECSGLPRTLAEWRSLADDDFGAFRMIEHFLGMTDEELEAAAVEFPKQIGGTMGRINRIKKRLAARYDAVTTVTVLLERALARAAARHAVEETDMPLPLTGD